MDFWFKTFFQTCTYTPTTLSQLAASYSRWRSLLFIHFSHQSYSLFTSQWFACHLVTTFGHLSLSFPCLLSSFSFSFQRTGFGSCAPHITINFPLFSEGNFQYIPWFTRLLENGSLFSTPTFHIPAQLSLDRSTLKSLNETYNTLDADLTRRLQAVHEKLNTLLNSPHTQVHSILLYFTRTLSVINWIVVFVFYCVCIRCFSAIPASVMVTRASSTSV